MHLRHLAFAMLAAVVPAMSSAWALDLTGKWRITAPIPEQFFLVTQSGSTVAFSFEGFVATGSVTPADSFTNYTVTGGGPILMTTINGRVMPGENLLDGRIALSGFSSPLVFGMFATRCTCDDGNTTNGDGCDAECRVEPCWTCAGDPSSCQPASEGSACEDGSPCTTGETCTAGACGGGVPVSPCTDMSGVWNVRREVPGVATWEFSATFDQRGTNLIAGGAVGTIVGTLDPQAGAFDMRSANGHPSCPDFDPLYGVVAPSGDAYTATGLLWLPRPEMPFQCDAFVVSECGNTTGDPITECNVTTTTVTTTTSTSSSTISPTSTTRPSSTTTMSTASSTTTTPTSTTTTTTVAPCSDSPMPGCRLPVESRKARLLLKDKASDAADTVKWTWKMGAATTLGELGDPLDPTNYATCLYDGGGALLMSLRIPGGGLCGDAPCWKRKGDATFRYADRQATRDGVKKLTLVAGPAGKARITLAAKGFAVPMPPLGAFALPVRMQLQGNGLCWEAVYGTPKVNAPTEFNGLAD